MIEPTKTLSELISHRQRHYDLCRAIDGTKLSIALDAIRVAGADPELLRVGEQMIEEGRNLILLANYRVGDSNRLCSQEVSEDTSCSLHYQHLGACRSGTA